MKTERLYLDDPWVLAFEARVVSHSRLGDRPSVLLDRSAFYPESGGQLGDQGILASLPVVDVQIDEDGRVHHLLGSAELPAVGAAVKGEVDRARRRSHMALHTGQHMLSRALLDVAGAETVSSRLGATTCTIDVHLPVLEENQALDATALVNQVIDDDVEVRAWFPTSEELGALPLRREPKVESEVRVVEVAGFDVSPCGGTHCTRTSQVGLVRLTGLERYKGKTRVSFSAGPRARGELLDEANALRELARRFTCGIFDVAPAIDALERNLQQTRSDLSVARGKVLEEVGKALERRAEAANARLVVEVVDDADAEALRSLATRLTRVPERVVLLAAPAGGELHVVVARGAASSFDCGAFLKVARERLGGKGGGRPERAEGRLPSDANLSALAQELAAEGEAP